MIKSGKNIMYTFTIMVYIANVNIIFLPDFYLLANDLLSYLQSI